jgi:hypothetical protein
LSLSAKAVEQISAVHKKEGSAHALTAAGSGNQPAQPQQAPIAASSAGSFSPGTGSQTLEGHADQIRSSISDLMGTDEASDQTSGAIYVPARDPGVSQFQSVMRSPGQGLWPDLRLLRGEGQAYIAQEHGQLAMVPGLRQGNIAGATGRTTDQDKEDS